MLPVIRKCPHSARARRGAITYTEISVRVYRTCAVPLPTAPVWCTNGSRAHTISCLGVGACLKVNTRALGRGALHKKGDSIPLLSTSEEIGAEPVEGPSEWFKDWGGRGYDDFVPGEVTKTAPYGDMITLSPTWSASLPRIHRI